MNYDHDLPGPRIALGGVIGSIYLKRKRLRIALTTLNSKHPYSAMFEIMIIVTIAAF